MGIAVISLIAIIALADRRYEWSTKLRDWWQPFISSDSENMFVVQRVVLVALIIIGAIAGKALYQRIMEKRQQA